jgi:uncharacterized peroxidase-related enzyme
MGTLPLITSATASTDVARLLAAVQRGLGVTPNMTKAMANSPALLKGYLDLSSALVGGQLAGAVREQVALAVAQSNSCDYCLSAHSYLAEHVAHLDAETVTAARKGDAADPHTAAVLHLAVEVNDTRGAIGAGSLDQARAAGVTDEQTAEAIGLVALNVLTNYFNKAAGVEVDFPYVSA